MKESERDLDALEETLMELPTEFLKSLSFRLDCIIKDRDTDYQSWLQSVSGCTMALSVVRNTGDS
jgi:hypothetical protein